MKKIVCAFLALLTLIPCLAWADGLDYGSMTADELRAVIADARAALAALEEPFADKCVVYDDGEIKVTLTGIRRADSNGWIYIAATVVNKSDHRINVRLKDTYMNGWKVNEQFAVVLDVAAQKNAKGELQFMKVADDAEITALDQLEDLAFKVVIQDADTYSDLHETDEQTVTFAW